MAHSNIAPSATKRSRADLPPFILAGLLMATIFHSIASLSFPQAAYLLATLRVVLFGALTVNVVGRTATRSSLTPAQAALIQDIPLDIRTVMDRLGIEPDVKEYACC
ncbi:hypothetical protein K466DRAFT_504743, partial [Polyporus arcularius HHB13444]